MIEVDCKRFPCVKKFKCQQQDQHQEQVPKNHALIVSKWIIILVNNLETVKSVKMNWFQPCCVTSDEYHATTLKNIS